MSFDKTFCLYRTCKHWNDCDRAYTDDLKKQAIESGVMFLSFFLEQPECYEDINKVKEDL